MQQVRTGNQLLLPTSVIHAAKAGDRVLPITEVTLPYFLRRFEMIDRQKFMAEAGGGHIPVHQCSVGTERSGSRYLPLGTSQKSQSHHTETRHTKEEKQGFGYQMIYKSSRFFLQVFIGFQSVKTDRANIRNMKRRNKKSSQKFEFCEEMAEAVGFEPT